MNSKEIFHLALNLSSPWEIENISFEEALSGQKSLHIEIGFIKGSEFTNKSGVLCSVHDRVERKWRHLNFFEHECYIHCKVPRIKSKEGKIERVAVPWAREGSGFTLLFEAYTMSLIEYEMPVNKVGATVEEYPNRIWNIFNYWVDIAYEEADHSKVKKLAIDETSKSKGHSYVTLAVDLEEKRVIHVTEGKDNKTIKAIKEHLEEKGCPSSQIEEVCIDMSKSFISGVTEQFKNAAITFDRFHVKKYLNEAMDKVRKLERKEHQLLKGHKYTFLKANENLTKRQKEDRELLIELLPKIGEAYRLKELFDDFWDMNDPQDAAAFLSYWCDLVVESEIQPFIKFTNTIKAHWAGILNYVNSKISNGIIEGINSKIQLAKRRARGYRNVKNYINMIYLIAGKLKFSYPLYST